MKHLKESLFALVLATMFFSSAAGVLAQTKEEFFSTEGTITQLDSTEKILHVKTEGGLELTFRSEDATVVKVGEQVKALSDLAVDDSIEIQYFYNENYEKVARTLIKKSKPNEPTSQISSEKKQAPST